MFILSILNSMWDYNKCVPKHVAQTVSQEYAKSPRMVYYFRSIFEVWIHAKDKIAHNPLRFGEGFGPELQTHIKRVRKTTNMPDAIDG